MKHFLSTSPSPTPPILDSYFLSFLVSLCKEKQFSTTPDPDQYTKILQLFFFHRCIVFHCVLVMVSVALPVDGGLLSFANSKYCPELAGQLRRTNQTWTVNAG